MSAANKFKNKVDRADCASSHAATFIILAFALASMPENTSGLKTVSRGSSEERHKLEGH